MKKRFSSAVVLLAGTAVGAGMFSLPYIMSRLGIIYGFFYLFAFAGVYFALHSMYAAIIQTKKGEHQFFYFAGMYLKKPFSKLVSWAILAELLLVLTVYLILIPDFFRLVWPAARLWPIFLLWVFGSIFIFFPKLSWLARAEFFGALGIFVIVAIIFFSSLTKPLPIPFFGKMSWPLFFLPFGPILFSLAGRPAIPKVVEEYEQSRIEGAAFSLKKSIFWGTFLPAILYLVFVVSVLRLNPDIATEAVTGFGFLSQPLLLAIALAGFLALWTSYFIIAVNIREILKVDLKAGNSLSLLVAFLAPLFLYFLGLRDFLTVVSFTGGVFLSLEGVAVTAMWRRAFPNNPWKGASLVLYLVFGLGLVYELIHLF